MKNICPLKNLVALTPCRSATKALVLIFFLAGSGFLTANQAANPATSLTAVNEEKYSVRGGFQKPVVLYISRTDCHFCYLLEEEVLNPLLRSGEYTDKIIFRNLVLDSTELVVDFKGNLVAPADMARILEVELTPTLLFLNNENQELLPRIVGYQRSEYYFYYLEETIHNAIEVINTASGEKRDQND
ncbi:MAG: thioredoxin fold domain-containing protein [Porticoccaceae bacterium]|nr:thioredoxin fold domain-containing protein [Porticoccaceae bacterium]